MSRVALLAALLAPALASAGGYYIPGIGTRSVGRAGAYVLSADDAGALWINPAALVRLNEPLYFSWDSTFVNAQFRYERMPHSGEDTDPVTGEPIADRGAVENQQPPMPIPSLAYVTNFGLEDFVFSIGGYGPQRGDFLYNSTGPERYGHYKLDLTQKIYQLTAAWRAANWVSLGAGFQVHEFDMQQYTVFSMWPHDLWGMRGMLDRQQVGWPEDPRFDAPVELSIENYLKPSFNAGVIFDLQNGLQVGGSFQYSVDIEADGKVRVVMPSYGLEQGDLLKFQEIEMAGNKIKALMSVPWIARVGARYADPEGRFDVELDFVYEAWSMHQELRAKTGEIHFRVPNKYKGYIDGCEAVEGAEHCEYHMGDIVAGKHWHDSWSIRLGGEVKPLDWLRVRGGYYFETGAIPLEYMQAGPLGQQRHGAAVGLTLTLGMLELDLAYSHVFQPDVTVRTASPRQVAPLNQEPEDYEAPAGGAYDGYATHIVEGRYQSDIDIFGFGFRFHTDSEGSPGRLTSAIVFEPVSHYVAIGVEASRYALEFEQSIADLIAVNVGVELAEARAYMLDPDPHLGLGVTAGIKFFLTDHDLGGVYLFPRCSAVYLWGAGPMLTPSGEVGYAWTWDDGLLLNLGISFLYTVYTDEDFERHSGPGTLLNFRLGYGW